MDGTPLSADLSSLSLDKDAIVALDRDSPPTGTHYGSLCSQYSNLDAQTISSLEKAILYSKVRAFKEAALAFDTLPSSLAHHPIILFERFLDYLNQWRLSDGARVLEYALAATKGRSADLERSGIYILIRIYLAKIDVFTKGDFTRAKDAMIEVRNWLAKTPIEHYTDIQVGRRRSSKNCGPYQMLLLTRPGLLSQAVLHPNHVR